MAADQSVEPLEDAHEGLNALELDNFEDFADARSVWTETSEVRDKLLQTDISTAEYLHKFPILCRAEGIELVKLQKILLFKTKFDIFPVTFGCEPLKTISRKILMKVKIFRGEPIAAKLLKTYENGKLF